MSVSPSGFYNSYPATTSESSSKPPKPPTYRQRKAQAEAAQTFANDVMMAQQLTGKQLSEEDVSEAMTLLGQMPKNSDVKLNQRVSYEQQKAWSLSQAQQDASDGKSAGQVLANLMWGDQALTTKKAVNENWSYMMKSFTQVKAPDFVKVHKDGGSDLGLNDEESSE
ncbi:MAG: hypothetical protein IPK79_12655 [Vampirovibrionales bacterium]|nr:hypothetical protein [Vampirovibrionales bacterium]